MKQIYVAVIVGVSILSTSALGAEESSLKQLYEKAKNSAYSSWTDQERKAIADFNSRLVHVFAAKIAKERKAKLDQVSLESDVPTWGSLRDVTATGFIKAVDIEPVSDQKNVSYVGKSNVICKVTTESGYLALSINLKADCVQYGVLWDVFEVRGKATIKDINQLLRFVTNQSDLFNEIFDISNFQISTSNKATQ